MLNKWAEYQKSDKTKKDNYYEETYQDTYLTYLALRDNSEKILNEISNIGFDKFIERSNVTENVRGNIEIPNEDGDILKELSIVSGDKNEYEYLSSSYYVDDEGWAGSAVTVLYFTLNINLNDILNQYSNTIIQLANSIQNINNNFNQFNPPSNPQDHYISINIKLITLDNYVIEIDDNVGFLGNKDGTWERCSPKITVYEPNSNNSNPKSFDDYLKKENN